MQVWGWMVGLGCWMAEPGRWDVRKNPVCTAPPIPGFRVRLITLAISVNLSCDRNKIRIKNSGLFINLYIYSLKPDDFQSTEMFMMCKLQREFLFAVVFLFVAIFSNAPRCRAISIAWLEPFNPSFPLCSNERELRITRLMLYYFYTTHFSIKVCYIKKIQTTTHIIRINLFIERTLAV
jgi:hypothetical protein